MICRQFPASDFRFPPSDFVQLQLLIGPDGLPARLCLVGHPGNQLLEHQAGTVGGRTDAFECQVGFQQVGIEFTSPLAPQLTKLRFRLADDKRLDARVDQRLPKRKLLPFGLGVFDQAGGCAKAAHGEPDLGENTNRCLSGKQQPIELFERDRGIPGRGRIIVK